MIDEPPATQTPLRANRIVGVLLVLLAAGLWGTLGTVYTLTIDNFGLTPITVVFYRAFLSAVLIGLWMLFFKRSLFKVQRQNWLLLFAYGLFGVTVFFLAYIYAVVLTGVTTAVLLLYTAPALVALMAWRVLGERMTGALVAALALNFIGVVLVAGAYDPAVFSFNSLGILYGVTAAATYALYSIFGKMALQAKIALPTMMFYMFLIGLVGLYFVQPQRLLLAPGWRVEVWATLLMLAAVQTLGALGAYTLSLHYLEASNASVIATFEPLVAGLLAFFVLGQPFDLPKLLGGGMILLAVLVLQVPALRARANKPGATTVTPETNAPIPPG